MRSYRETAVSSSSPISRNETLQQANYIETTLASDFGHVFISKSAKSETSATRTNKSSAPQEARYGPAPSERNNAGSFLATNKPETSARESHRIVDNAVGYSNGHLHESTAASVGSLQQQGQAILDHSDDCELESERLKFLVRKSDAAYADRQWKKAEEYAGAIISLIKLDSQNYPKLADGFDFPRIQFRLAQCQYHQEKWEEGLVTTTSIILPEGNQELLGCYLHFTAVGAWGLNDLVSAEVACKKAIKIQRKFPDVEALCASLGTMVKILNIQGNDIDSEFYSELLLAAKEEAVAKETSEPAVDNTTPAGSCGCSFDQQILSQFGLTWNSRSEDLDGPQANIVKAANGGLRDIDLAWILFKYPQIADCYLPSFRTTVLNKAIKDYPQVVKILLENGVDIEATEPLRHEKPVYVAIENENMPALELLLNMGAEPNGGVSTPHCPPLHAAIVKGLTKAVSLLLAAGADINKIYQDTTPLHVAVKHRRLEIAKELLRDGANIRIEDWDGRYALYYLPKDGSMDVLKKLASKSSPISQAERQKRRIPRH